MPGTYAAGQPSLDVRYASDLPGSPSNPYNFLQDWGRSTLATRLRFQLVGSVAAARAAE